MVVRYLNGITIDVAMLEARTRGTALLLVYDGRPSHRPLPRLTLGLLW